MAARQKEACMKPLLPALLLCSLILFGCAQNTASPAASPGPVSPEVIQATFTPSPSAPSPTPTTAAPTQDVQPPAGPTPEATPTPEAGPTPTAEATQPLPGGQNENCIDKAAFFADVTIPDGTSFKQGVSFTKTWQIRNEGTCRWDGYKLVYAGGDLMNGPLEAPMPVVEPGALADISVELKSPPQGGVFTGLWEFQNTSGQRFGVNSHGKDLIWVKISVSWYTEENPPGNVRSEPISASPPVSAACQVQRNADAEGQILALVNQARAENNLPALTLQTPLSSAAYNHSADMACNNHLDHTGTDGSNWAQRIAAQGYQASYTSENIYAGDPAFGGDAAGAFDWWMHSDIHRKNILSTKVTSIGIGAAFYAESEYKAYYTIDFARP